MFHFGLNSAPAEKIFMGHEKMEKRIERSRNETSFRSNRRPHNSVVEMNFASLFADILGKENCDFFTESEGRVDPMTSIPIFSAGNEFPF